MSVEALLGTSARPKSLPAAGMAPTMRDVFVSPSQPVGGPAGREIRPGDVAAILPGGTIQHFLKETQVQAAFDMTAEPNVDAVCRVFLAGLEELAAKYPNLVSDARGRGLLLAFDMPTPDVRNRFLESALARGVFASYTGSRSVRLRPHLITTEVDVRTALSVFDASLSELAA